VPAVAAESEAEAPEEVAAEPAPSLATPVPQPEPETKAIDEVVCLNEPATGIGPEETAEEAAAARKAPEEPAPQPDIHDEPVDAIEVVCLAAPASEASPDSESPEDSRAEAETTAEAAAGDDPVPELAARSVESIEASNEQAPEPAPEPADLRMDLIESIPEQIDPPARPDAVSETAPIPEAATSNDVPVAETSEDQAAPAPEAAAEEAVSAEEPIAEMPINVPIIDEPIIAEPVIESATVPALAAVEPAAEVVPEPVAAAAVETSAVIAASPRVVQTAAPEPAAPAEPPAKPFIKLESRDNQADLSPFSVVVSQVYDGPLDLLLDLIRKQDIDIYDIPIARITAQFLAYVNQLKATDVDVAGEFIYTASLLIHIKSKMLLPRAPAGPDDAAEDPRRELVERLLEHERFKNAAQMLQQKQMLEAATWTNPGLREFQDDESAEPEIAADTVDLVRIFRDILERARNRPVINVQEDSVTVGQMIQFLSRRLTMEDKPVALRRLLSHTRSERALIAMFLALLELVRLQAILLRQDRAFSEIFIKKHTGFESVMNDGLASARDDWR